LIRLVNSRSTITASRVQTTLEQFRCSFTPQKAHILQCIQIRYVALCTDFRILRPYYVPTWYLLCALSEQGKYVLQIPVSPVTVTYFRRSCSCAAVTITIRSGSRELDGGSRGGEEAGSMSMMSKQRTQSHPIIISFHLKNGIQQPH
jgi:hypothetical protein